MQAKVNFIEQNDFVSWFEAPVDIFHCQFDYAHYDDLWYQRLNIEFYDKLNRAVAKRRAEFLAGRYCATEVLKKYDLSHYSIGIGKTREPLFPDQVYGSISHCDSNAVAVVGQKSNISGVGIDIEKFIPFDTVSRLKKSILDEDEQRLLFDAFDEAEVSKNFTIAFSVKESFYKAAFPHVGKIFDFDAVSIIKVDDKEKSLLFRVNYPIASMFPKGKVLKGHYHVLEDNIIVTLVSL